MISQLVPLLFITSVADAGSHASVGDAGSHASAAVAKSHVFRSQVAVNVLKERERADQSAKNWWEEEETQDTFASFFSDLQQEDLEEKEETHLFCYKNDNGERIFTPPLEKDADLCHEKDYFAIKFMPVKEQEGDKRRGGVIGIYEYGFAKFSPNGFAKFSVSENEVRVNNVKVYKKSRGQGLAAVITAAAFLVGRKIAESQGHKDSYVVVRSNQSMMNYLERKVEAGGQWEEKDCGGYVSGTTAYVNALCLVRVKKIEISDKNFPNPNQAKTVKEIQDQITSYKKKCVEQSNSYEPTCWKKIFSFMKPVQKKMIKECAKLSTSEFYEHFGKKQIYGFYEEAA